jgi:outer membrane protein assembly factor BamE (lipoprotein component of BamABCDE complex)
MTRRRVRFPALAAFVVIACTCRSGGSIRNLSKLRFGMTPEEVHATLGEPQAHEAFVKDGKQLLTWSYILSHQAFHSEYTFECLTFSDGQLVAWVQDYGTGGHSNHRRQS